MNIAICIPAYNESKTIQVVINKAKEFVPNATIYVCDNASTDNTAEIAKENGAILINEPNKGKGNAIRKLIKTVDADCFVLIDADNELNLEPLPQFIEYISRYEADIVIGNRFHDNGTYINENKNIFRRLGNKIIFHILKILFNSKQKEKIDILCGMRAFSKDFATMFPCKANSYDIETEMTIFALQNDMKIKSIPVIYTKRTLNKSKLNPIRDGFLIMYKIFSLYILTKKRLS